MTRGIDVAKTMIGLQEVRDRQVLMERFKKDSHNNDLYYDPSKTPWCALCVNVCEREAGNPGTGSAAASSFEHYGTNVDDQDDAQEGDIIVFTRVGGHHVAYFVKWNDNNDTVTILGGNQGDKVCYEDHTQKGIVAIRRPRK